MATKRKTKLSRSKARLVKSAPPPSNIDITAYKDLYDKALCVPQVLEEISRVVSLENIRNGGYGEAFRSFMEAQRNRYHELTAAAENWKGRALKAEESVTALKGEIAELTERLARTNGYLDRALEDDAIARGISDPVAEVERVEIRKDKPFRRMGPNTGELHVNLGDQAHKSFDGRWHDGGFVGMRGTTVRDEPIKWWKR